MSSFSPLHAVEKRSETSPRKRVFYIHNHLAESLCCFFLWLFLAEEQIVDEIKITAVKFILGLSNDAVGLENIMRAVASVSHVLVCHRFCTVAWGLCVTSSHPSKQTATHPYPWAKNSPHKRQGSGWQQCTFPQVVLQPEDATSNVDFSALWWRTKGSSVTRSSPTHRRKFGMESIIVCSETQLLALNVYRQKEK